MSTLVLLIHEESFFLIIFSKVLHEQVLWWTIFLIRNRFWPLITNRSYYSSYFICIMVHLAWRKGALDWITRVRIFESSVLHSQLYILHLSMFVKNSQAYLCLFVLCMAISEYLPVENISNLPIFIEALIKSSSS